MQAFLEFLIGFSVAVLMWMIIEYLFHRFPMHSLGFARIVPKAWESFEAHTRLHHSRFFKQFDNEPDIAAKYASSGVDPLWNTFGSVVVWLPIGVFLSWYAAGAFIVVAWLHGYLWTKVHWEMHWPKYPWWGNTRLFQYISSNHEIHHEHSSCNYAALFPPFMDIVMCTRRKFLWVFLIVLCY